MLSLLVLCLLHYSEEVHTVLYYLCFANFCLVIICIKESVCNHWHSTYGICSLVCKNTVLHLQASFQLGLAIELLSMMAGYVGGHCDCTNSCLTSISVDFILHTSKCSVCRRRAVQQST